MTKNHSTSPLRQRMIDDMTMRKLSSKTQSGYIRAVKKLPRFSGRISRDSTVTEPRLDVRHYGSGTKSSTISIQNGLGTRKSSVHKSSGTPSASPR